MVSERTMITLARMAAGVAILVTSLVTHTNGVLQGLSLFLIGVPVEMLHGKTTTETASEETKQP